jgi:murein DD-endopeptidase
VSYINPVSSVVITDDFGEHVARRSVNPGTDYAVPKGTPVFAIDGGTVLWTDTNPDGSGGRMVGMRHDGGAYTESLHLSKVNVTPGQVVPQGGIIGYSGGSAWGSESGVGTHLHLTFRPLGRYTANRDFEGYVGQPDVKPAPGGAVDNRVQWKGIQEMLRALYGYTGPIDGIPGLGTWKAFQRFLKASWGYTGPIDGIASPGGNTWRAAQRWLKARWGYTGPIDGKPGSGTMAALNRANNANASAF